MFWFYTLRNNLNIKQWYFCNECNKSLIGRFYATRSQFARLECDCWWLFVFVAVFFKRETRNENIEHNFYNSELTKSAIGLDSCYSNFFYRGSTIRIGESERKRRKVKKEWLELFSFENWFGTGKPIWVPTRR